jgi:hypothetical protein
MRYSSDIPEKQLRVRHGNLLDAANGRRRIT